MRKYIIIILIAVIATSMVFGVYDWQNNNINNLQTNQIFIQKQISKLQSQYAAARSASAVSTANWKNFCDPFVAFCFNYPNNWTVSDHPSKLPGDNREFATVNSPAKSITINYENPLIKDGGSTSVRVVKTTPIIVGNTKLALLGIIPISSGVYQPSYIILGNSQALGISPSDNAVLLNGSVNSIFSVGKYDAIHFAGGVTSQNITSYAQAKAWFESIDGKTVQKILESLTTK